MVRANREDNQSKSILMTTTKMCSSVFQILGLALVLISCSVNATIVNKCEEGNLPDVVVIDGCDSTPCIFILDTEMGLAINFTAPIYLENIAPRVLAYVADLEIEFPVGKDACDGIENTSCPIEEGELVAYKFSIQLSSKFIPETSLGLQFAIINKDENEAVECFELDITTKKQ